MIFNVAASMECVAYEEHVLDTHGISWDHGKRCDTIEYLTIPIDGKYLVYNRDKNYITIYEKEFKAGDKVKNKEVKTLMKSTCEPFYSAMKRKYFGEQK